MERSLTVLLPIHDAAKTLSGTVQQLLEVLPELTGQFEVLIVDDGTTEATTEAAHDLSRDFPQVRVIRQGGLTSREAAIRTGLARSNGEIVMLGEDNGPFRIDEIHRVWRSIQKQESLGGPASLRHLPAKVSQSKGLRIIEKRGEERLAADARLDQRDAMPPKRPNYLRRLRDFALGE